MMWFMLAVTLACALVLLAWLGYSYGQYPSATPPVSARVVLLMSDQLSPTELRYRLIEQFGEPFSCDPDLYPVARQVPIAVVRERVQAISNSNPELFQGIIAHLGITDPATFTDDQASQVYAESKRLAAVLLEPMDGSYQFQIRISDGPRQGQQLSGLITENGDINSVTSAPVLLTCPRCLAGDATIDTPDGFIPVKDLRRGMLVWTADPSGVRRQAVLVATVERRVPLEHEMTHLVLSDGRELFVAAGHPTLDGRFVGNLSKGDRLDHAAVVKAERVRYHEAATYDILPAGETGAYWANGILLGSTIFNFQQAVSVHDNLPKRWPLERT
jgi:hypothetical protein